MQKFQYGASLVAGPAKMLHVFHESGGRTWARTKDPLIKSQLLYQLSYASIGACGHEEARR